MKEFLLTLMCVISIVSAGVLEKIDEELSIVGDSKVNGRSGSHRISEMTHEDLMHQKFLLDVLQHVNEPIVNEELLQLSNAAENHLIGDQNLYKENIDADMAHVIELSRSQNLLGKNEAFTIADEEHTRQMIGLYRVLVGARDWETLKKNIIHGRAQINGALFVNSLYLAIRDREDTNNFIIPGIHEILPELYIDGELVQGAKQINLNQLEAAQTTLKTVGPQRSSILEMIGVNKLLRSKNKQNVGTLDRRELWMPWREMHMEIAARKAGKDASADGTMSAKRIVITAKTEQEGERGASGLELLTEDVGFQAFLQTFMSDLCLHEKDTQHKSESEWKQGQNKAGLSRVGLHEDAESRTKSGMRYYEQQTGAENTWNTRVVNIDEHTDRVGRHSWTSPERDSDMNGADDDNDNSPEDEQHNHQQQKVAHIGRVGLKRNSASMQQGGIRNPYKQSGEGDVDIAARNVGLLPTGRHYWDQSNQQQNGAELSRIGLNKNMGSVIESGVRNRFERTGDDSIWNAHAADTYNQAPIKTEQQYWSQGNVNWNSPRINAFDHRVNAPYSHGWDDEPHSAISANEMQQRNVYNPASLRNSQRSSGINHQLLGAGPPTNTASINQINARIGAQNMNSYKVKGVGAYEDWTHNSHRDVQGSGPNMDDKYGLHSQWSTGMPMDWNRQMAMRAQKSKIVDERQAGHPDQDQQASTVGHNLRELDIDDERLLPFSHRKLNRLSSAGKQGEQQQKENQNDHQSKTQEPNQPNERNQNWNNVRGWTMTAARGMGNIGVHERQDVKRQHVFESMTDMDSWAINKRDRQNTRWDDESHNTDSGQQNIHWPAGARNAGHWMANNDDNDVVGVGMGVGKKRYPRSLLSARHNAADDRQHSVEQVRGGELLLHNLQQLVARINLEQIAHELDQAQDDIIPISVDIEHSKTTAEDSSGAWKNRALLEQINEVEKHLQTIIRAEVERKIGMAQKQSARNQAKIDEVIGDALMGKDVENDSEMDVLNILRALIQKTALERGGARSLTQVSLDLNDPVNLHVLRRIVHIADAQRQEQLLAYRTEDIQAPGITINEVQVDKLHTFMDTYDVDLVNARDESQEKTPTADGQTSMLVARQQRLNHKDFTIKIDVNAERNQRVVVRTLLGPKIQGPSGTKTAELNSQRHNYILLDAYIVELSSGRNQLKRKSRDITWTAADTTPYNEIYKRVLHALNSEQVDITLDELHGQTCRFPHRLLLPRGSETGLPMQMLVVITPVEDEDRSMQQWALDQRVCGIGVGSANLDHLPLGFPLDRAVKSAAELSSLTNVHLMDVQIYHDKQVKVHDWAHDMNAELVR